MTVGEENVDVARKTTATKEVTAPVKNGRRFRLTVEPLGFLYLTAGIVQSIVTPNLYLYKVCAVNFKVNASLCDPRSNVSRRNIELADRVQSYVSTLHIYGSLIDNIPSIFIMLFLIPWSDKHGRKPLMIIPIVGHVCGTLLDIANYYFESWSAEYLLLSTIPVGLTGGRQIFVMTMHRYMIDITTIESRTWRLSFLGGVIGIAVPLANLLSGYIYANGGNIAIWGTALALYAIAFLYTVFMVTDSRGPKSLEVTELTVEKSLVEQQLHLTQKKLVSAKETCMSVFKNIVVVFTETFKKREGHKRACISILIVIMCLSILANAMSSVGYLFSRKKFGWDAADWAYYLTIVSATSVLGTLVYLPLMSGFFKVRDGVIGVIAMLSSIATNLTMAFTDSSLIFRLASIGHLFSVGTGIVIRSIFSKTLNNDELSKAYAVLAALESLMPLISSPSYNLIYQSTFRFFPGCIYLTRACGNTLIFSLFFVLLRRILLLLIRRDSRLNEVSPFTSKEEITKKSGVFSK